MSSDATAEVSAETPLRFRWIIGSWSDLLLFVATPLLIAPLVLGAQTRFSGESIYLIVTCFGALGHHAPGLMRAYGDRALFQRFRVRFTLVPIVALAVCSYFSLEQMNGVMLVLLVWGVWHFLMQTYGFARIYDAKAGCHDATTRYLDLAMCIGWFVTCALYGPDRMREFSRLVYQCGFPTEYLIPIDAIRTIWFVATVGVTLLFLFNIARKLLRREAISGNKLLLLGISFAFLWFCSVSLTELIVGVAMFEIFHDVQYLTIVWLFNENRVRKGENAGPFTRFLFRRSGALIGVYIGLVVAYGMIGLTAETISSESLKKVLFAIIATSNVLHFYYDGFIWKIREQQTGDSLDANPTAESMRRRMVGGFKHSLKWAALGAVVATVWFSEQHQQASALAQARAVADVADNSSLAHAILAKELVHAKRFEEAIVAAEQSEKLSSEHYQTFLYWGVALASTGQPEEGLEKLKQAEELHPQSQYLQFHLASTYMALGKTRRAIEHLHSALDIDPNDAASHYNLAALLSYEGKHKDAVPHYTSAARLNPENALAWFGLAETERLLGRLPSAASDYRRVLEVDDSFAAAHYGLAIVLHMQGKSDEARPHLKTAITTVAAIASPTPQDLAQRVQWAEEFVHATGGVDAGAVTLLAVAYEAVGRTAPKALAENVARAVREQNQPADPPSGR